MITSRRFIVAFIFLLAVLSCAEKDILVGPLPQREYDGEYIVTHFNQSGNDSLFCQWIYWTFSDMRFWMKVIDTYDRPQILCDLQGDYRFTGNPMLIGNLVFSNLSTDPAQCDQSDLPEGAFLYRSDGIKGMIDSIYMIQITDSAKREIRLARRR